MTLLRVPLCGPRGTSTTPLAVDHDSTLMKITEEVREYAAQGMAEKAEEFREAGQEIGSAARGEG